MNNRKKSRKLLVITTVLTIIALASVLFVYAAVNLFTATGGNVTVTGVTTGTIEYATTITGTPSWSTTLSPISSWYAELLVTGAYVGPVTITWQLNSYATGSWQPVADATITTSGVTLTGEGQTIYATATTTAANNVLANAFDWSTYATGGTYQIVATVASAP